MIPHIPMAINGEVGRPISSRAVDLSPAIGMAGVNETLRLPKVDPIPALDGSVGYSVGQLLQALDGVDPRSILWIPQAAAQTGESEAADPSILDFGNGRLTIDTGTRSVHVEGEVLTDMPNKEFTLLHYLAANNRRILPRATIFLAVWGDNIGRERDTTIDTHVARIRRKLGQSLRGTILTARSVGYGFDDRKMLQG